METAVSKKKRPFGFYVCAIGFTFERCAFYTVKYLLAIWIATNAAGGGLGLTDADASLVAADVDMNKLFGTLYNKALEGDAECGGLLA